MIFFATFCIGSTLVSLILLCLGLRGYKVSNHPVCRKCKFDLCGTWPGINICTECGTALDNPNRIIKGQYKKRPIIIVLAIIVLLPALIWQGYHIYHWVYIYNWYAYIPTALLMKEVDNNRNLSRQNRALNELSRRIALDRLSDSRLEQLTKAGLSAQSDITVPWQMGWGDIIQSAWLAGKLGDRDQAEYALHSCNNITMVIIPSPVRQSEFITAGFTTSPLRVGDKMSLGLSGWAQEILLDGKNINSLAENHTGVISAYGNSTPTLLLTDITTQNIEIGIHTLSITWKLTLLDGPNPTTRMPSWTVTTVQNIEVLAAQ